MKEKVVTTLMLSRKRQNLQIFKFSDGVKIYNKVFIMRQATTGIYLD